MNAIELLKQDHRTVRDLFKSHEAAGDNAVTEKRALGDRIFSELDVHTQIEEEMFYPAARGTGHLDDLVAEANEEHRVAKNLISELRGLMPGSEGWDAKMKVLGESVDHHIEEEETELFPKVQEYLGKVYLQELGERMAARKRELSKPTPTIGSSLVKMVTKAYDSLTGNGKAPRKTSTSRRAGATARPARKAAKKSVAKSAKRVVSKAKRVATNAKSATTKRVRATAKKTSARASAARTRVAKVVKGTRKKTAKSRRSARR